MKKKWSYVAVLVVSIIGYLLTKTEVDRRVLVHQQSTDIRYLPTPRLAKALAIGFKNVLADIYWIEGLNYFGTELTNRKKTYRYLSAYCDLILHLDPFFKTFYDWAATIFTYNGLPITRESIRESTYYANAGIRKLNEIQRFDSNMMLKGAFNYALEAQQFPPALPYFTLAARSFEDKRDLLLVGSTYAFFMGDDKLAADMKVEYLGYVAFQLQTREDVIKTMQLITSSRMNSRASEFIRSLRVNLESDKDMKKLVETRLQESMATRKTGKSGASALVDPKINNILSIDFQRNWIDPELHVLLSL